MESTAEEKGEIEEAYSPSGSLTPPNTDSSFLDRNSSKQPLPSTLQNMLASITKKSDEPKSIDLKSDPIVQAYKKGDVAYSPEDNKDDQDVEGNTPPLSPSHSSVKSIKVNRDPRQRPSQLSLSQLTDDEVIKKASELGFMNPENPEPIPDVLKTRTSEEPSSTGSEQYDPFAEEERSLPPPPMFQPPPMQPMFGNPPFPPNQMSFNTDFPPPPPMPPSFLPPNQFQASMFQGPSVPPLPPLPPSQIPFTNPQPPPPPPPPPATSPPPPPLPDEPLSYKPKKKKSKKERSHKSHKKGKRKHSESPPPRNYDSDSKYDYDKSRDRDRYSSKRREKRDSWRSFDDRRDAHEKRRESWEFDVPPPTISPPPQIPGPSLHQFGMRGPMRGGPMRGGPMRGRFHRGMRGGFRRGGFDRGFHRGRFHPRGVHHIGMGPPPILVPGPPIPVPCPELEPVPVPGPGPSRNFTPKNIHIEYEEDIRRFEEQRLKQKNLDRRKWRTDSPPVRRRRGKDSDSD